LVILPGNTASSVCHQQDLTYFSQHFTAVSMDYLGTGQSDRLSEFPEDWFSFCADQVAALISFLGTGPAVLLGVSGGAVVALRTAAAHSTLVRGVIADSFSAQLTQTMVQENVVKARAVRSEGQIAFWRFAQGEDWENVVEQDTAMLKRLANRGGNWLGEKFLNKVHCPVFLSASLEDSSLPDPAGDIVIMLKALPDGRAFLADHGDHPLIWSAPQAFREAVSGFLARFYDA
jgi:pimeloyl-ACP methyl ester carboxylesterase